MPNSIVRLLAKTTFNWGATAKDLETRILYNVGSIVKDESITRAEANGRAQVINYVSLFESVEDDNDFRYQYRWPNTGNTVTIEANSTNNTNDLTTTFTFERYTQE